MTEMRIPLFGGWTKTYEGDLCQGGHPGGHYEEEGWHRCHRCGRKLDLMRCSCGNEGHTEVSRSFCPVRVRMDQRDIRIHTDDWEEKDQSYDGGMGIQQRLLTPRECDIASRTMHDIMEFVARESTGKTLLSSGFYTGGFLTKPEALEKLNQVLRVSGDELLTIHALSRAVTSRNE